MCGIVGIISNTPESNYAWLEAANRAIRHRGPDDFGYATLADSRMVFHESPIASALPSTVSLAHRRLSILDLSPRGRQPMISRDGTCAITFNGEIYNFVELRAELEVAGAVFSSESDTEVLLELLMREGEACLYKLRGMFGFCFVNLVSGKFLLARDPFGIKPLYFASKGGKLAFASELRCFEGVEWIDQNTPAQFLFNYIRFGVTNEGRSTLFSGIRQVPPASVLQGNLESVGDASIKAYWEPELAANKKIAFPDAVEELRRLFLQSVRLHLRSDVPVGAALSGGVDSSAIVCCMRLLEPDLDLHTFTYSPKGFIYDESKWANIVAERTGAKQHLMDFTTDELVADLSRLLEIQEDPFGSFSIYAQYCVFKKVSETPVKVMLDGQGGDETLAGYDTYLGAQIAHLVRRGQLLNGMKLAYTSRARNGWKFSMQHLLPPCMEKLARWVVGKEFFPPYLKKCWFDSQGVKPSRLDKPIGPYGVSGLLWDNMNYSGLPQLLHFEDKNSMAFSLESRVPFLEQDFVSFALSLPGNYHVHTDGTTKYAFKEAMRGIVPDVVLDRRDKIGFHAPGHAILIQAEAWINESMNSALAKSLPWLDHGGLLYTYERIKKNELSNQHEQGFWRVICYLQWLNSKN